MSFSVFFMVPAVLILGAQGRGGSAPSPTFDQVKGWVEAYQAAHPGNGGKDWDINAKSPAQIAADPTAQQLLSICGPDQRPVIPLLAWEYGGGRSSLEESRSIGSRLLRLCSRGKAVCKLAICEGPCHSRCLRQISRSKSLQGQERQGSGGGLCW